MDGMLGLPDRRILIVEDDAYTVAALRSILELMLDQRDVWVAQDGHEGIRLAYEHAAGSDPDGPGSAQARRLGGHPVAPQQSAI